MAALKAENVSHITAVLSEKLELVKQTTQHTETIHEQFRQLS